MAVTTKNIAPINAPAPLPRPSFLSWATLVSLIALALGLWMRLWMLKLFPQIYDDSLLYGGIAKNLLLHGVYAHSAPNGEFSPTLIRLPGYPLFIAACFKLFGMENYFAVQITQILIDLAAGLLLADFIRRITGSLRAALAALVLNSLCPFTAVYSTSPLAETLTIAAIILALWSMELFATTFLRANSQPSPTGNPPHPKANKKLWLLLCLFALALTFAALLRPDGLLVAAALAPALLYRLWRNSPASAHKLIFKMAAVALLIAAIPFTAWTWRNWQAFHVFEPLAPRYATDPGEPTNPGFNRWMKTWCFDFLSTYYIYWNVPDGDVDVSQIPDRAYDTPEQRSATLALFANFKATQEFTPEMDAQLGQIADARIHAHPLRYYLLLPLARVADMWLRPRIENLPIDYDWWVYSRHHYETKIAWALILWNALYIALAACGFLKLRRRRPTLQLTANNSNAPTWALAMLAYFLLRSLMLATIEGPEARYTLECFPMLFALGAAVFTNKSTAATHQSSLHSS